jgi:hypothetical protein
MKRTLLVFLLVNLILSACAPVSAPTSTPAPSATPLPTATTTPTSTATPTSTPTAVPTATPMPIPTIQVGNLSVPDPRVTNPELFDLRNPDAPIPQFVNAMKMAGIEITAEQVAQGITYEALKGKGGNPFVVAVYNLASSLFPEKYRDLAGPIPLLIAKQGERGWEWKKLELDTTFQLAGIKNIGALMDAGNKYPKILNEFNLQMIPLYEIPLGINENARQESFRKESQEIRWRLSLGTQRHLIGAVIAGSDSSFHALSQGKKKEVIIQWLQRISDYKIINPIGVIVFNEMHEKDYSDQEAVMIAQLARENYPNMKLAYNDTDNHYEKGMWTNYTRRMLNLVGDYVDAVGVQMHLAQWPYQIAQLPTPKDIASTLRSYGKEVWVTEFDITTAYLPGDTEQKRQIQALIAYNHVKGALDSGVVTVFNIWGLNDNESWYNNFGEPEFRNSEPLPFNKQGEPKAYYYYILKAILDFLSQGA